MKHIFAIGTIVVLSSLVCACNRVTVDSDSRAIQSLEENQNRDFNKKDVSDLLGYYADDAVMIAPGEPTAKGKKELQAALTQLVSDPAFSLHFRANEIRVAKSGDLAYTQGTYVLTATDPESHKTINDKGSYVTTYGKQADGSWKILTDIITSQSPMPGAAQ
jgi:uncharacterized protein (TIGR02246 family)